MKTLIATLCLIIAAASGSSAQDAKKVHVYLGTGGAFPAGDFNIKYNAGINGFVGLGFSVTNNFELVPKVEFQSLAIDPFAFDDTITGGDYTGLYVGIDARFAPTIPNWIVRPVGLIGFGLAFSNFDQLIEGDVVTQAHSETDLYGSVGLGVDFALSAGLRGFVLARYTQMASGSNKKELIPITAGIRF